MLFTNLFTKTRRPWLSDSSQPYPPNMPFFIDPTGWPEVKRIEENWTIIRDELLEALAKEDSGLVPYKDLAKTDKKASWSTAGLVYWTVRSPENIARFPKTWALFKNIPNVTSCSIHRLSPHSTIKPHIGDTDAMARFHVGLVIPAGLPRCGFRCGTERKEWVEGKALCFNDAQEHTAWNNTDDERFIISFDLMYPEYFHMRHWIGAQVLGKISVEVLYQHKAWLRHYFNTNWARKSLICFFKAERYAQLKLSYWYNLAQQRWSSSRRAGEQSHA
ncbi:aspartyl/asparaginyl beta-hydroxylase domain-containing protein [Dyella jejuensis]|uniref:Aspartyl/asparaginyl beta-hydroxylase domain-containing protein n=1 Tax=Dyella jejuensis TaxID=1432009 RepID=A0ABW8JQD8_9GAMM